MEWSGDSVAMLHDDKAGRDGPLELISSSSGPLNQQVFETLPKCYPFVNFACFSTKTHLHPEGYPPPRCDHSSLSLRPQFFVNYTFKREVREFYANHDNRYV